MLSVVLANVMSARYGLVPAGFGLLVSAGTYAAGLALGLRDALQDAGGKAAVLAAIVIGAVLSYAIADARVATASAAAFLLGEIVDLVVYTPVRRRGWARAVVLSNAAGAVVDSLLFLYLAGFGVTGANLIGQLVGKAWVTLAFVVVGALILQARRREASPA